TPRQRTQTQTPQLPRPEGGMKRSIEPQFRLLTPRIAGMFAILAAANIGACFWAFAAFRDRPVLLGNALLAYSFGLRHAVDADHIAAIDNVTRKLLQEEKQPGAVGLFF